MERTPKLIFKERELGRPYWPTFKGPFFIWRVNFNTDGYSSTSDDFVVLSSGRRQAVHRYLWLKLLYDELSSKEFLLFLSMSETLKNNEIVGFLRAKLEVPKTVLRQRLLELEALLGKPLSSRDSYIGYRRMRIDILTERRKLPKTPKFSGYIKNNSRDKGGRLNGTSLDIPEISSESVLLMESIPETDWYELLTVGEITLLGQSIKLSPKSL